MSLGSSDQGLAHKSRAQPFAGIFPLADVRLGLEGSWERERDNEAALLDGVA